MSELTSADESCLMPIQELNLQEALELAIYLQQKNRLSESEELFCRILAVAPNHPDALHYYGVVKFFQGEKQKGMALIEQALLIAPEYIQAYNNLGNMYLQQRQFDKAEAAYRKLLGINPEFKTAYNNLGVALKESGRIIEAVDTLLKAIQLDPYSKMHYQNLGNVFKQKKELENAMDLYLEALLLRPFDPDTYRHLSAALKTCGEDQWAVQVLRQLLMLEPDNSLALHTLSAYTGANIPTRADDGYVRETFDRFANSFDAVLQTLDYQAPFLVEQALRGMTGLHPSVNVLDAGCGTGLCGPLLRPWVGQLTGVDLSGKMLALARERHVYDELVESELTAFLQQSDAAYDVIVSADVLCYFGDLTPVLSSAAKALKIGGHVIFTIEELEIETELGYRLNAHGRYSHRQHYVTQSSAEAGLAITGIESVILRLESGEPVAGLLVKARQSIGLT